jgi:putative GTP pyrophosphokinase
MPTYSDEEISAWYRNTAPSHEALGTVVASTLSSLLKAKKIDFLAVSNRTKTLESVIEKVGRKEYADLDDLTDITGVRVIAYIESDLSRISAIVREAFQIHADKSVDKSEELSPDKFGYRSVHYICELGSTRIALPELAPYKGLQFEIQLRTVLQHAWAEIEHDRSYKFSGGLPSHIRRRLNLLAGVLELADREFASLAHEVDAYSKEIKKIAKAGKLHEEEVTSISLREYLQSRPNVPSLDAPSGKHSTPVEIVVEELKRFGVKTVADFDALLSESFLKNMLQHIPSTTTVGFVRMAMMYADIDRYLEDAWKKRWTSVNHKTWALLVERYGTSKLSAIMDKHGLSYKQ